MSHSSASSGISGLVFNIQRYSIHDGPGIRTTVFLKGCPLRCAWCCNPESQNPEPEISRNGTRCLGPENCGACLAACPHGALEKAGGTIRRIAKNCVRCGRCVQACPAGCFSLVGRTMTAAQVAREIAADILFYGDDGGFTLSGGEALFQPEFARAICMEGRKEGLHAAIETSALAPWEKLASVCEHLDQIIVDVKHMDDAMHHKGTRAGNALILENIRRLGAEFPRLPKLIRCPVIPGFNDDEENIRRTARFAGSIAGARLELLAYHRLGEGKYENLGREYELAGLSPLPAQRMKELRQTAGAFVETL